MSRTRTPLLKHLQHVDVESDERLDVVRPIPEVGIDVDLEERLDLRVVGPSEGQQRIDDLAAVILLEQIVPAIADLEEAPLERALRQPQPHVNLVLIDDVAALVRDGVKSELSLHVEIRRSIAG